MSSVLWQSQTLTRTGLQVKERARKDFHKNENEEPSIAIV